MAGVLLACVGYLVAMTPSLVPRTTAGQVTVSVILSLTGYALGALLGSLTRWALSHTIERRQTLYRPSRRAVDGLLVVVVAAVLAFTPFGLRWQTEQAEIVGWVHPSWVAVVVWTPVLFGVVLLAARGVRAVGRALARRWSTAMPAWVANVAVGVLLVGLFSMVLVTLTAVVGYNYYRLDADASGQTQPTSELRSGSPESLVSWDELGRQGRYFVSEGPSAADISGFSGVDAAEPIRVYVGKDAAHSPEERASLAVDELRRTGGLERESLVIVVTSGLGSVHPVSANTLEYATNGDVATVATQFSKVPSWLTTVVDAGGAQQEAEALITAVLAAVEELPEASRPKVYLHGESLGAYGSQQYYAGTTPEEMVADYAGVLWVGTPAASDLVQQWAEYPEGTPVWEPVVGDGSVARFAAEPTRIPIHDPTWGDRRVLFLHSATDPVVHLSGSVATSRPSWLLDDRGDRVPEGMVWWPIFTWEQILLDMTTNGIVPPGLGHNYSHAHAAGWIAVMQPEGWSDADVDRLNEYRKQVAPPDQP